MNFIKQMKKREFIEMGLKALTAFFIAFLVIILMEGMIYGIKLNTLKTKGTSALYTNESTLYCIEQGEDEYFVVCYNPDTNSWSADGNSRALSREDCLNMGKIAKETLFRAPNAFEFSITGVHYVVMAVFVSAVAGFFVYKFIMLNKSYKKIEEEFIKTGSIEISNL